MQEEAERLNRHEEGPKPEMKAESEPEKTDHGEDIYFSDTAEISSNTFESPSPPPIFLRDAFLGSFFYVKT